MNIGTPVRVFLARRPWIYWVVVLALAASVALGVRAQLTALAESRDAWEETQRVWVADVDHEPGEAVTASLVDFPVVAVPPSALVEVEPGATVRQRIAAGEVLVAADVTLSVGPTAQAEPDEVVVPITDSLLPAPPVGVDVSIYAEGIVLAQTARVVGVDGDVMYVAVSQADGPIVAAAAQLRTASVVFTP